MGGEHTALTPLVFHHTILHPAVSTPRPHEALPRRPNGTHMANGTQVS